MKQRKSIRNMILGGLFLLVLCLFCGCGATVDTNMTIEDGFTGDRTISLTIDSEDLTEYVTGGITGLETVITENIPSEMTYDITTNESGASVINFHITFSSLEDYKTKVTAILTAGGFTEAPEIEYDRQDNPFKQGVVFTEDFDSIDLMEWYKNALQTAGIISESSTSNWYERGQGTVAVAGMEFSENYDIYINEMVDNTLNDIDVETTVSMDGSIVRVVDLCVSDSTYTTLKENGCTLDTYLKELVSDPDTLVREKEEYSNYHHFIVTLHAANAGELAEKTNKLLKTEGNTFGWEVVTKEDAPGYGIITVKETLNTSFYVNSYCTTSAVKIFENAQLNDGEAENIYSSESGFRYSPNGEEVQASLTWKIGFEKVELDVTAYGKENLKAELKFTVNETFDESLRASAFSSVENYAGKFQVEKEENVLTVSVKGTVKEVTQALNELAKGPSAMEMDFVTIEMHDASTPSPFTSGKKVVMEYDFSELIGESVPIVLSKDGNVYLSYVAEQEDGALWIENNGELSLYKQSVKVFPIILVAVFVLLICGSVLLVLLAKNEILGIITFFKNVKIQKPAKQPPSGTAVAPAVEPSQKEASAEGAFAVETSAGATAPRKATVEEESEDEEVLL